MPNWTMNLNVKLKTNNSFEHQTKDTTLNAKLKIWLWMPNWRCDSECQIEDVMALNTELETNNGFEHQTKDTTLNTKM